MVLVFMKDMKFVCSSLRHMQTARSCVFSEHPRPSHFLRPAPRLRLCFFRHYARCQYAEAVVVDEPTLLHGRGFLLSRIQLLFPFILRGVQRVCVIDRSK